MYKLIHRPQRSGSIDTPARAATGRTGPLWQRQSAARLERHADEVGDLIARGSYGAIAGPSHTSAGGANSTTVEPERDLPRGVSKTLSSIAGGEIGQIAIHAGPRAHAIASGLDSRAVTIGRDIFFARGEFRPQTVEGSRLLSHEMVHVAQQRRMGCSFPQSKLSIARQEVNPFVPGMLEFFVKDPVRRYVIESMQSSREVFEFAYPEQFWAEVDARVDVLRQFPEVKDALIPSGREAPASPRAERARSLFMQRDQLEGSATQFTEFARRVELMDLSLRQHGLRMGLADNRVRNDSERARKTMDMRKDAGWYDLAARVGSFKQVVALMLKRVSALELEGRIAPGEGFIRELAVFGHGFSGTESSGFQFGENWVDLEYLKEQETGALASVFVDGATIDLVGCDAAKGPTGNEFMIEMARVFFGSDKRGYIRANTCNTTTTVPELETAMMPCSPRTLRWPLDIRHFLRGLSR